MSNLEGPEWEITAWGQSMVNELSSRVKERCKVKGRQVIGRDSVVFHCGPIKVIIPLAAEFPMRSIQDMGDTQLPQPELVVRHEPDTRVICMCNTSAHIIHSTHDAYMSPKYRRGHTSSQWRQECGAECKTSSSAWIVGIFLTLLDFSVAHRPHFFSSAGFVSLTFRIPPGGSQLSTLAQSKIGFLSVIPKIKMRCTFLKTKPRYSLLPLRWQMHQSNFDCRKQLVQFSTACQLSLVKISSQWSYWSETFYTTQQPSLFYFI